MELHSLMLAYTASAVVALAVVAGFSAPIGMTLFKLLPEEAAPHWARFVKFAVAVAAFAGGLPTRPIPTFVDRNAPPPPPPDIADGLMMVMSSASGALMAAAWVLMIFFAVTLISLTAGRAIQAVRQMKEREKARDSEPIKRIEPAEARPVPAQEKPAVPSPPRRH